MPLTGSVNNTKEREVFVKLKNFLMVEDWLRRYVVHNPEMGRCDNLAQFAAATLK